jgi:hypothetical protein
MVQCVSSLNAPAQFYAFPIEVRLKKPSIKKESQPMNFVARAAIIVGLVHCIDTPALVGWISTTCLV